MTSLPQPIGSYNEKVYQVSQKLEMIGKSLDTISEINPSDITTYEDKKMQFVAKGLFGGLREKDSQSYEKTLRGINKVQSELKDTLEIALTLLRDEDIPPEVKDYVLQNKIIQTEAKLHNAEYGFENLKKSYLKEPEKYEMISASVRTLRKSVLETVESIYRENFKHRDITGFLTLHTHPLPFPSDTILDDLPINVISEYAKDLREELNRAGDNTPFLEKHNGLFFAHPEELLSRAKDLHRQFVVRYCKESPVTIDQETGYTVCTLEQFKVAVKNLRHYFPGSTTCAVTDSEKKFVAQLLQTIIYGTPLNPDSEKCFLIRELKRGYTPDLAIETRDHSSILLHQLETITHQPPERSYADHLNNNLQEVAQLFRKDCIDRTLNSIIIDGRIIPIGLRDVPEEPPLFLKEVHRKYTQYLKEHPKEVARIIEQNRRSDFFAALKEYSEELELHIETSTVFPEEALKKILENELRFSFPTPTVDWDAATTKVMEALWRYSQDNLIPGKSMEEIADTLATDEKLALNLSGDEVLEIITENWPKLSQSKFIQLQEIIKYSRMSPDDVEEIAASTKCRKEEVECLLRMKTLELMMLMNQGLQAIPTKEVIPLIFSYQNPLDPTVTIVPPKGTKAVFDFSEDFQTMRMELDWDIKLLNSQFTTEGIQEFIEEAPVAVKASSTLTFSSITASGKKQPPLILNALQSPAFSWKVTDNFIDHMSATVSPDVLEREIRGMTTAFEVIANLEKGQIPVYRRGMFTTTSKKELPYSTLIEILNRTQTLSNKFTVYANGNIHSHEDIVEIGEEVMATFTAIAVNLTHLQKTFAKKPAIVDNLSIITAVLDQKVKEARSLTEAHRAQIKEKKSPEST